MSNNLQRGATAAPGKLLRAAIWVAIGAIVVAAVLCVVWVIIGDDNAIITRAFWTVALLAAYAGAVLFEVALAPGRAPWITTVAIGCWTLLLLVGAVKIWLPIAEHAAWDDYGDWDGVGARLWEFILIVVVVQLAFVHQRIMWTALSRVPTVANRVVTVSTSLLIVALAAMIVLSLTLPRELVYTALYWRVMVSLAILAAVGSALLPLMNALFAPKKQVFGRQPLPQQAWPTYPDGRTPLPMLPGGAPDFSFYQRQAPMMPQAAPRQAPGPYPMHTPAPGGHPGVPFPGGASQRPAGYPMQPPAPAHYPAPGAPSSATASPQGVPLAHSDGQAPPAVPPVLPHSDGTQETPPAP